MTPAAAAAADNDDDNDDDDDDNDITFEDMALVGVIYLAVTRRPGASYRR